MEKGRNLLKIVLLHIVSILTIPQTFSFLAVHPLRLSHDLATAQ